MPTLKSPVNLGLGLLPAIVFAGLSLPGSVQDSPQIVPTPPGVNGDASNLYNEGNLGHNESISKAKSMTFMPQVTNPAQSVTLFLPETAEVVLHQRVNVGLFPCDLSSLPEMLHPQIFEDFAGAVEERDLEYLDKVINGWLTTSALYSLPATRGALDQDNGFDVAHARLLALMEDDEDDDEQVKPSGYAFNKSLSLLIDLKEDFQRVLPRPSITTDFNEGVRFLWQNRDCQIRLVVPSYLEGHHYLYHEQGEEYGAEDDPSPVSLANWLLWLTDDAT